jgi:hypothetical protein
MNLSRLVINPLFIRTYVHESTIQFYFTSNSTNFLFARYGKHITNLLALGNENKVLRTRVIAVGPVNIRHSLHVQLTI